MNKIYKYAYIILFILPIFLFLLIPIRGQKERSTIESRFLVKIPSFNIKSFIKGEYQEQLEESISDQLVLSNKIRKINLKTNYLVNNSLIQLFKPITKCNYYVNINKEYYKYGCSNYIIEKQEHEFTYDTDRDLFNSIKIPKYIYFVEKDCSINFNSIEDKEIVYNNIKKYYHADDYARFEINSFDEFKEYFYQTDHHWNKEGQLKGYREIIRLLLGENEETLAPIAEKTYDVIFYGSADRKLQTKYSKEKFSVYKYPELEYDLLVNGKDIDYSHHLAYDEGKYAKLKDTIYAKYYGEDYAEVIYDFHQPEKKNLLVICLSYSNSIKDLIASHFNKTYYVDTRHFEDFDVNSYIEEHDIDMVLMLGDITMFDREE